MSCPTASMRRLPTVALQCPCPSVSTPARPFASIRGSQRKRSADAQDPSFASCEHARPNRCRALASADAVPAVGRALSRHRGDRAEQRHEEPHTVPGRLTGDPGVELPWDRLNSARATKRKPLGAICWPEWSGRRWRRSWSHRLRGLGAVRLAALSAACRLSDLFGRNGSLAYALLLCQCHLDPFE